MCTINKSAHTKKKMSGNLFNDPRIYIYIYITWPIVYDTLKNLRDRI